MISCDITIHIGFHKTATSAIQEFCATERDQLLARGVWYPPPTGDLPGHQDLAWVLMAEQPPWADKQYDPGEVERHYTSQLATHPGLPMLISSEEFCREPERVASALRNLFSTAEIRIVAYVRDPFDFLVSRYLHEVTFGEPRPFAEFVRAEIGSADFAFRLGPWVKVFRKENVVVRPYARNAVERCGVVDDFLSMIGVHTMNSPVCHDIVNPGAPAELGYLFAYLNSCAMPAEERQRLKQSFLAVSRPAGGTIPLPRMRSFFLGDLTAFELDFLDRCRKSIHSQFDIQFAIRD